MNETDAWITFTNSGSILDYLRYSAMRNAVKGVDTQEVEDEDSHRWADYQGTEYR